MVDGGIRQPRTVAAVRRFFEKHEGESNIHQIHEWLNDYGESGLRHGCTMQRLSNILSKSDEFTKTGEVTVDNGRSQYKADTYILTEEE
jgi:hypothetical protein